LCDDVSILMTAGMNNSMVIVRAADAQCSSTRFRLPRTQNPDCALRSKPGNLSRPTSDRRTNNEEDRQSSFKNKRHLITHQKITLKRRSFATFKLLDYASRSFTLAHGHNPHLKRLPLSNERQRCCLLRNSRISVYTNTTNTKYENSA
jgi:hypothetical protein